MGQMTEKERGYLDVCGGRDGSDFGVWRSALLLVDICVIGECSSWMEEIAHVGL